MKEQTLEQILEESFLDYSAFILQRRALPDARDNMKYTGRQILHAQYREKLTAKHKHKKTQKSVAAATAFSYVHGDSSAYGQIIRMGRPYVQRYLLEDIIGNGGTPVDPTDYSASRYTECRLSPLATEIFNHIEDNVLQKEDWELTYDEEGLFPKVLPSLGYYNLVNGSYGSIGVGLISSIPQFNLREMNEQIISLIDNPNHEVKLLPDFAAGGILLNPETTQSSLSAGEGRSALLRGKVKHNPKEGYLEIYELPYSVYTNTICKEIEKGIERDSDCPISTFKDLTKTKVNIRVYSKDLVAAEEWLYAKTSVQKHFTIKLIMLDLGKTPKLFTLKGALQENIQHNFFVLRNHYLFQLKKLKEREEIIRGLLKAYSILDQIIELIKASQGRANAIVELQRQYEFSQPQAEAIVDLRLHRLSQIDIAALNSELEDNLFEQDRLNTLLTDENKFKEEVKVLYKNVADKYGDARRTEITTSSQWEKSGGIVGGVEQDYYLNFNGLSYWTDYQERESSQYISTADQLFLFTNFSRTFYRSAEALMFGEGVPWTQLIKLQANEQVVGVITEYDIEGDQKDRYLIFERENGDIHYLHHSFLLNSPSVRGRLLSKYRDIKSVSVSTTRRGTQL